MMCYISSQTGIRTGEIAIASPFQQPKLKAAGLVDGSFRVMAQN